MRMTRDERERKYRNVAASCDLERVWNFVRELMQDLLAAESDLQVEIERNGKDGEV
jgi:hypothetical protein